MCTLQPLPLGISSIKDVRELEVKVNRVSLFLNSLLINLGNAFSSPSRLSDHGHFRQPASTSSRVCITYRALTALEFLSVPKPHLQSHTSRRGHSRPVARLLLEAQSDSQG